MTIHAIRVSALLAAVASAASAQVKMAQMRYEERVQAFDYDREAPLDLRELGSKAVSGVLVRDVSYASPKGGRVPAYLVTPEGKGRFAGIVFVHWGQGNRSEFLAEAMALARRGAESVLIDAPFNRVDNPNRGTAGPEGERDSYIQLVVDARRAVDLLQSRAEVDGERIGYVGHSLGATWGGALAGAEKRIRAFVLMGGLPSVTELDFPDPLLAKHEADLTDAELRARRSALERLNPMQFVGHAPPATVFFQWAEVDRYISAGAARKYFNAAAEPKWQRTYYCGHEFNDPQAEADRGTFLGEHLGLR